MKTQPTKENTQVKKLDISDKERIQELKNKKLEGKLIKK